MMKPNYPILLPVLAILLLIVLNTCIALRQQAQRDRLLNLVRLQDETIFNAIKCMDHPSDTAAMKDFLRSYEESEKAWQQLPHSLGSAASLCEETH